jgi:hypothetical protein
MINQVVLFDMDLKAGLTLADTLVTDEHVRFLVVQRQSDITGSTTEIVGCPDYGPELVCLDQTEGSWRQLTRVPNSSVLQTHLDDPPIPPIRRKVQTTPPHRVLLIPSRSPQVEQLLDLFWCAL